LKEKKMKNIPKREYTAEFRELTIKRVQAGQTIVAVNQSLRNWIKATGAGKLNSAGGKVVTPEQMELSRRHAENIRLKRECEILKKRWRTLREKYSEVCLD
jgi:transposase